MIRKKLKKLKQLEDIEQEIGIDLITLVKLLKEPIYYLCLGPIVKEKNFKVDLNEKSNCNNRTWCDKSSLIDCGWKVYDFEDVIIEEDGK